MPYRYVPRPVSQPEVKRLDTDLDPQPEPEPAPAVEANGELSYRDLQALAKELDIPANQSREDLEAAVEEATR